MVEIISQVDIRLPYYLQVLGLGASPTDTVVSPGSAGIGLEVGRQPGNLPNTPLESKLRVESQNSEQWQNHAESVSA